MVAAWAAASPEGAATSLCDGPEAAAVDVALIGPPGRRGAAREVLDELVAARVRVRWSELVAVDVGAAIRLAPAEEPALAHVYVDLRGAPLLVYIADRGHARVLIRRVELPAEFDEAAREEVGAIVSSSLDALCAGGTIGVRVRPAAEPEARVANGGSARWSGGVLARYRVMGWAPTRVQQMLEVGAVIRRRRGRVAPQAIAWVGAVPPSAWQIGGATLQAEVGAVIRLAPRWSQLLAAGGGVELLRGAGSRWTGVPIVQAQVGLRAALGRGVVAELRAHVAVDLVDTRVIDGGDGRVLFDPWRVRPGLSLAFGWLGGSR